MVDLAIGGAIASLKAAGDLAASFLKVRDTALIQANVIELQSVILAAQQNAITAQGEQVALLEQKRALEAHITALENWDREKGRYFLKEVAPGSMAYVLRSEAANGDPPHVICADCFERGQKSYLAATTDKGARGYRLYRCNPCGNTQTVDPRTYSKTPDEPDPGGGPMVVPRFAAV